MGAAMLGGAVMAGRASQRASNQRQDQEAQQAQAQAPAPPAASEGLASQIQQLADLKQSGVLTDEEFETAKQKLLAG